MEQHDEYNERNSIYVCLLNFSHFSLSSGFLCLGMSIVLSRKKKNQMEYVHIHIQLESVVFVFKLVGMSWPLSQVQPPNQIDPKAT